MFENQTRRFGLWISNNVEQLNDVRSTLKHLQNLDLSFDLNFPFFALSFLNHAFTFLFLTGFRILITHLLLFTILTPVCPLRFDR